MVNFFIHKPPTTIPVSYFEKTITNRLFSLILLSNCDSCLSLCVYYNIVYIYFIYTRSIRYISLGVVKVMTLQSLYPYVFPNNLNKIL